MLTKEQNDLITLTDAGTPGGELMRRYWQPVALSEELSGDTPVPTRIFGEDLVLFRDPGGQPRLIGRYCPHRSVDLSYGRLDKGGLRCIYHGWLMSGDGRCLEQPGEPATSDYKDKIRHTAYPCHEAGGLILTYMGPGRPPRLPDFPFMTCPPEHGLCYLTSSIRDCREPCTRQPAHAPRPVARPGAGSQDGWSGADPAFKQDSPEERQCSPRNRMI